MTKAKWADKARQSRQRGRGTPSGACVEGLEGRRLLATAVWTSQAQWAEWDNPANWQGNVVPADGDDITFPAWTGGVPQKFAHTTRHLIVGNLTFEGGDSGFQADGGTTIYGNVDVKAGKGQVVYLTFTHDTTINVAEGGDFIIANVTNGQGYRLTTTGGGTSMLGWPQNVSSTQIDGGYVSFANLQSPATVNAGGTLSGQSYVGGIVGNGGTIRPGTATAPSTINSFAGASLPAGTTLEIGVGPMDWMMGMSSGKGQLYVSGGAVDIAGSTLAVKQVAGYVPAIGDVLTIVANNGGGPTIGTFDGMPDGATVRSGPIAYQIHYNVGSTGHDVTLTAVEAPTVQSSAAPANTRSIRPVMSVLGHDPRGGASDADLTYTWAVASKPDGARTPRFGDNATTSATSIAPRFFATGTYSFECTITNPAGVTTVQTLTTTIRRRPTHLRLWPHATRLHVGDALQFGGRGIDQFGGGTRTRSIAYTLLEGNGTLDADGRFVASGAGHVRVQILLDGLQDVCGATVLA